MDRFNHSVNERITSEDLNRPGMIVSKGVLRDFEGPLTGGTLLGFLPADLGQGILFGLNVFNYICNRFWSWLCVFRCNNFHFHCITL